MDDIEDLEDTENARTKLSAATKSTLITRQSLRTIGKFLDWDDLLLHKRSNREDTAEEKESVSAGAEEESVDSEEDEKIWYRPYKLKSQEKHLKMCCTRIGSSHTFCLKLNCKTAHRGEAVGIGPNSYFVFKEKDKLGFVSPIVAANMIES